MFIFIYGLIGTAFFAIINTIYSELKTNISANQWFFLATLGLFNFLEQMSYSSSLKHENANVCSLILSTSRVLFGFLFEIIFFNVIPDAWTMTGAIIVTTSVSLISFKKLWDQKMD
jgi:drug/metabolite transporter (DMT)-like permease